jgi:hypothetical protein
MKKLLMAVALCLLSAICSLGVAEYLGAITLQWNSAADWPVGTTVEACINADCVSGITSNEQSFTTPPSGTVLQAKARAIPPTGYQCGDPLAICQPSVWAIIPDTALPSDQNLPLKSAWTIGPVISGPIYVAQYATAFNSETTPKTAMSAVPVNSGDVLVAVAAIENSSASVSIAENGTGNMILLRSSELADYCSTYGWAYIAPSNENMTVSFARSAGGSGYYGGNVIRFSGSSGIGNSNVATGDSENPLVSLVTTQDNSTIVVVTSDWRAVQGSQSFTNNFGGTPVVLSGYLGDNARYGVAITYFANVGAAGSKTVGMSAPTGQKWTIIAIEVKGHVN